MHTESGGIEDMTCNCSWSKTHRLCSHMAAALFFLDGTLHRLHALPESPSETGLSASHTDEKDTDPIQGIGLLNHLQDMQKAKREEQYKPKESDQMLLRLRSFHPETFLPKDSLSPELLSQAKELLAERMYESLRVSFDHPDFYPREKEVCTAYFDSILSIEKGGWQCRAEVGTDSVLYLTCRCKEHETHKGKTIFCRHEAAALLLLQDYFSSYQRKDFTNEEGRQLLALRGQVAMEEEVAAPLPEKKTSLALRWENGPSMKGPSRKTFQYGKPQVVKHTFFPVMEVAADGSLSAGALYKEESIPNMRSFLKNLQKEKTVRLQGQEVSLSRTSVDEGSLPYLDFLNSLLSTQGDLLLQGESLDTFFTFCAARQILVRFVGEKPVREGKYTFWDGKLEYELTLRPEWVKDIGGFQGVTLSGSVPPISYGEHYGYFFQGQNFIRTTQIGGPAKAILALTKDGFFKAQIGQSHMPEFMFQTLPWLQSYVPIKVEERETIDSYLPQQADILVYLDYLEKMIVCRAEACYGPRIYSLSEHLKGQPKSTDHYRYRNVELEKQVLSLLVEYLPEYDPKMRVFFLPAKEAPEL
ncbi:MAG: SNF2 helicase associated domain-containing protein, partial [Blautia sp.]|nr:SNF2 helicase associated domain-containing protein [Blautia sp.]